MVGAAAGTVVCLVCTYIQWQVNSTCVVNAICIVEHTRPDGSMVCKDLSCGYTLWIFVGPAIVLGATAVIAATLLLLRQRRGRPGLA
jgi:hypothetical protein